MAGSIPARRIGSYIPEAVARFGVRYMDKKAVAPKTGTTAAGTTKTATKKKAYRRILMRSAPVSGKK